jgi:hypothetical protein
MAIPEQMPLDFGEDDMSPEDREKAWAFATMLTTKVEDLDKETLARLARVLGNAFG